MTKWKILTIIGITVMILLLIVNLVYVYNLSQNDASSETTTLSSAVTFGCTFTGTLCVPSVLIASLS